MLGFGLHLAVSKYWMSLVMACLFLCVVVAQPMHAQFSGHLDFTVYLLFVCFVFVLMPLIMSSLVICFASLDLSGSEETGLCHVYCCRESFQ